MDVRLDTLYKEKIKIKIGGKRYLHYLFNRMYITKT